MYKGELAVNNKRNYADWVTEMLRAEVLGFVTRSVGIEWQKCGDWVPGVGIERQKCVDWVPGV
jgi:hypothetical protein